MQRRGVRASGHDLLRFYRGEGADHAGRSIDEIWAWDDARLERTHDYIQWLFPLWTPSAPNPAAPLLDADVVAAFLGSDDLRARLLRSFRMMIGFYGLAIDEAGPGGTRGVEIAPGAAFEERRRVWLHAENHNHLRLTRIMSSTHALGLREHAAALWRCLETIARTCPADVTPMTLEFWRRARPAPATDASA
jgi:hypothetical protein